MIAMKSSFLGSRTFMILFTVENRGSLSPDVIL